MLTIKAFKIKFENSNRYYDFTLKDCEHISFEEQQKMFLDTVDYETLEVRKLHHLFNTETHMFVLNTSELLLQGKLY